MTDLNIKMDKGLPKLKILKNELIEYNNNELVIKDFFFNTKKVDNVFRYILSKENDKFVLIEQTKNDFKSSKFNDCIIDENDCIPNIVIVLESPHKNEYNEKFEPIAPAQGSTGNNIKKLLVSKLEKEKIVLKENKYKVLIINPVPYQTSLNFIHKKALKKKGYENLRDVVWKAFWEKKELEKEFINQINNLKPKLILNCCTKNLKGYVSNAINKKFETIELNHPFSWMFENFHK